MSKSGPNYIVIAVQSAVGGVIGAGAAFGLGMRGPAMGAGGAVGFVAVFAALVGFHAVQDTKKLAATAAAKKKTDEGYTMQAVGKLDKAERLFQEALDISHRSVGDAHLITLTAIHALANVQRLQGKLDNAEKLYRRALPLYEKLVAADHPSLGMCHKELALTCQGQKKYPEALQQFQAALAVKEKTTGDFLEAADTRLLIARTYADLEQRAQAIEHYKQVVEEFKTLKGDNSSEALSTMRTLASCYYEEKMFTEAVELLKELLMKINKSENPNRLVEVEAFLELAEIRLAQNQVKDVEPLAITALKVLQNHVGPNDRLLQRAFSAYRTGREKSGAGLKDNDLILLFSSSEREAARDAFKENPEWVNNKDKTGWSTLQWASFLAREDLLKWLLRNGAQPNNYDASSVMGPIHVSGAWGKMAGLEALLDAGVDINSPGPNGWTPVFYSAHLGREEITRQLVIRSADINRRDAQGRQPAHLAAAGGRMEVLTFLLGQGFDVNSKEEKTGRTCLHLAALNGHGPTVEMLMNNQADLTLTDAQNETAVELARKAGHKMLVKAMEERMAPEKPSSGKLG